LVTQNLGAFRTSERVVYVDAEVPNGAFDLRMAERDLNGADYLFASRRWTPWFGAAECVR
jgi:hypothetical protein